LLVKSGDALERLAEADLAVFDKTGTLTFGRPVLTHATKGPPEMLSRAARLARASRHPLARALAHVAGAGPIAQNVREVAGEGLESEADGIRMRLGRAAWVSASESADDHASVLWYREGDAAPLRFTFEDTLRDDAAETIAALRQRGLEVELLSGDRIAPVSDAALRAGIRDWKAATETKGCPPR
jgi:Cu2+-exporting ATPase